MKLTDFGLWFQSPGNRWSITIPPRGIFSIWYDGHGLGVQYTDLSLGVEHDTPYIVRLKHTFPMDRFGNYRIDRQITMEDFDIIPNPNYRGAR
jgi:hypothetical protein